MGRPGRYEQLQVCARLGDNTPELPTSSQLYVCAMHACTDMYAPRPSDLEPDFVFPSSSRRDEGVHMPLELARGVRALGEAHGAAAPFEQVLG